jgi:signal transduction histidine kinase
VLLDGAFFLILAACLARYLMRHHGQPEAPWIIALSSVLALVSLVRPVSPGRPWLGALALTWGVLVILAPSFAWCAVPLVYSALQILRPLPAVVLVAGATILATVAPLRLAGSFDPVLAFAPLAVAAAATALFLHLQGLVDDLTRTRNELAATERRAGTLAERQRLSMEIHDTLAQGMSSQRMLLQAADRLWDLDPEQARDHVRSAARIGDLNLVEARRFVHDLAPADLAAAGGLPGALAALAARETALPVAFRQDGRPLPLSGRGQAALLRVVQGALANVREHAGASRAVLTLTYLDEQVVVDVADDGRGFAVDGRGGGESADGVATGATDGVVPGPAGRGHGLPAMRARMAQLGGTLAVESTPGEGTVVTATLPADGAA